MPLGATQWTFTWDAENRLIATEKSDAKMEFKYDYMSRRVEKKVCSFSCKLLISNGQPPSLASLSRHARRSALAKAGSDMASFADAQS